MSQKTKKIIFTYLSKEMPSCMNLCLKTWEINLPAGYKIVVLNQKNISEYIPAKAPDLKLDFNRVQKCSFINDFIAALVLYHNGGIFLEPDILMTDKFMPNEFLLQNTDLIVLSDGGFNICSGFMMANKKSKVLEELIRRYNFIKYLPAELQNSRNFLLKDVIKEFSKSDVLILNCDSTGYYMDKSMYGVHNEYLHKKYYYSNAANTDDFFEVCQGLTHLNHNYVADKYKNMDEEEFLKQDILLAQIFKKILNV